MAAPEWQRRMQVSVSKLEVETANEMNKRNLARGMLTDDPVVLWYCKPDLKWTDLKMAVFLDGDAVHGSERQQMKDQRIKEALERKGWRVLRISYSAPASKARKQEIWDEIESFLRTHERFTSLFGRQ